MVNKEKLENHIRKKIEVLKENIISYKQLTKPIPPDNSIGRLTRKESGAKNLPKSWTKSIYHQAFEASMKSPKRKCLSNLPGELNMEPMISVSATTANLWN